ncbi:hypothetical protein RBWH47_05560 [Rhodopirellula baltica WH47]|uniref:Uncharacterized protein n=1 Tax=Rhodopirellula baltica WH47 TaxID=991778 RepID=F2AP97_RHOBT|nr:hypothetical protein RBWH47_05560 [Rhodopirellula baltica WH47]
MQIAKWTLQIGNWGVIGDSCGLFGRCDCAGQLALDSIEKVKLTL